MPFPMFGFECGDGWFDLVWRLCEDLEKLENEIIEKMKIEDRANSLLLDEDGVIKVTQVKEKLGTLRFYLDSSNDQMEKRIAQAENESEVTCEKCGKPGKMRDDNHWYSVSCDKCYSEKKRR
jgi:DNA replicative helicase MCM subunit Mcm2 (Cdc46/Mcm family)